MVIGDAGDASDAIKYICRTSELAVYCTTHH